jgi:hypothetical protein
MNSLYLLFGNSAEKLKVSNIKSFLLDESGHELSFGEFLFLNFWIKKRILYI